MSADEYEGEVKNCAGCARTLPRTAFTRLTRRSGNELASKCRECDRERSKANRAALRLELLTHYSVTPEPSCCICGEVRLMVLEIDHRFGGGRRHRSAYSDMYSYYRDIKRNDFTDTLRVLCRNCNWIEYRKGETDV